jgi:hypothetical protein
MNSKLKEVCKAIFDLNLDPIKEKLMHVESGEGWTLDQVKTADFEYRRFLCLMKLYPNEQMAPLTDVDIFWHYHILDTMKYAIDCQKIFGYFLHHYPYVGLAEDEAADHRNVGARMHQLYAATFGHSGDGRVEGATSTELAYCSQGSNDRDYRVAEVRSATTSYCSQAPAAVPATGYCSQAPAAATTSYCSQAPSAAQTVYCSQALSTAGMAYCSQAPSARAMTAYCSQALLPATTTAYCSQAIRPTTYCSQAPRAAITSYCSQALIARGTAYCSQAPSANDFSYATRSLSVAA